MRVSQGYRCALQRSCHEIIRQKERKCRVSRYFFHFSPTPGPSSGLGKDELSATVKPLLKTSSAGTWVEKANGMTEPQLGTVWRLALGNP